jgi:hypothetical protein
MLRTVRLLPLHRAFDAGLRRRAFPPDPASLLPGLLTATRTGLSPASDNELTTGDLSTTRSTSSLLDAQWNKIEHRLFSHITMNWRGRPLTSHEVIVQSIAATTTRTGLRVHAELDTNTYATKVRIRDQQHDALPVTRHDWHGDWNYTLRPETYEHINTDPDPFDQPSPDLAWLLHPALTGLPTPQWDTLITTLMTLHPRQREANLDKRRGHRPRLTAPGTGRRPVLTLADRLLATVLHHHHALPQTTIATLFNVRPETINRHIRQTRQLLHQTEHTIQPGPHRLTTLNDLYNLATAEGITTSPQTKSAC